MRSVNVIALVRVIASREAPGLLSPFLSLSFFSANYRYHLIGLFNICGFAKIV